MTRVDIIGEITKYMDENGVRYWSDVYVGISKDPRARLFNGHGVDETGVWVYCVADSSTAARDVEAHLLSLGADGGPGGGDATADVVYAYKKTTYTQP